MNEGAGAAAVAAKKKLSAQFFKKGVFVAIMSGICYGLYSAFMTLGMTKGIWADWYGPNTAALSAFVITYLLGSLGSAINLCGWTSDGWFHRYSDFGSLPCNRCNLRKSALQAGTE